jgi:hypothetical protein
MQSIAACAIHTRATATFTLKDSTVQALENSTPRRRAVLGMAIGTAVIAACGGGGGGAQDVPAPPVSGKAWQANGQVIDQLDDPASGAQVAINTDGIGFAVWLQSENGRQNVFASRYSAGVWGAAQAISASDTAFGVDDARIAVHPNGEATAVWAQDSATDPNESAIMVSRYVADQWTPANALVTPSGRMNSPQIASSANGSAVVVWLQQEGIERKKTWAVVFSGTEFGLPINLDSGNGNTFAPQVAMNSKGDAVAVWEKRLNGTRIETRSFVNGVWNNFSERLSSDQTDANSPVVALGDNGQAVALWVQKTGTANSLTDSLFASRRNAANQWAAGELLETDDSGNVFSPQITLDAQGNATAVWEQQNSSPQGLRTNIWANRLVGSETGGAWLGAQKLEFDDTGDARSPSVGSDSQGKAIAVWDQFDGTRFNVFSARLSGTQWSAPELIEQDNAGSASLAHLAVNPSGRALAVWLQRTGPVTDPAATENIVVNVFK